MSDIRLTVGHIARHTPRGAGGQGARRGNWILTYDHNLGGDSGGLLSKLNLNPLPWLPPLRRGW